MDLPYYREYDLPWTSDSSQERKFQRLLKIIFIGVAALSLVWPFIPTPEPDPDEIIEILDIPYTISGKKMEAPIKKILLGMPLEKSINFDAMRNPESVEFFIEFSKSL